MARGTPSVMKALWMSEIEGGRGWLTRGWSGVPIEERWSMPVKRFMERTFCILRRGGD